MGAGSGAGADSRFVSSPAPSHSIHASGYRGRFAPSPTGQLHFGSLVAATASYLDALSHEGSWLIRIEDVDTTREVPGSAIDILDALQALGFRWTEPVVRQSARTPLYQEALDRLLSLGLAYPCSCSRAEIQSASALPAAGDELRYPGWCRDGIRAADRTLSYRLRVPKEPIRFTDAIQGELDVDVSQDVGDFVVRRRDGLFAYQLAVVVDDADQGITHVVRGADLLNSTPRQLLLQQALELPKPAYAHVPVAMDRNGIKLSKSAGAGSVDLHRPGNELWRVLRFLRQKPPADLRLGSLDAIWAWAIEHWSVDPLHGLRSQPVESPDA